MKLLKLSCVWLLWLVLSSAVLAASAQRHAQGATRRAARRGSRIIAGCMEYSRAGHCRSCEAPRYKLGADGTCVCAPGFSQTSAGACQRGDHAVDPCADKCGQTYLSNGKGGTCSCDYWCDNHGDCCGGTASKNAVCKNMVPTINKDRTSSCPAGASSPVSSSTHNYRPSNCWCDSYCTANNDCCPICTQPACNKQDAAIDSSSSAVQVASVVDDSTSGLRAKIAAEAAALAEQAGHPGDCSIHTRVQKARASIASVSPAAVSPDTTAETIMQQCQASDTGAPKTPYVIPVYFTAGQICDQSGCIGGDYTVKNVQDQMAYLNAMYARTGIQFTWDGVINKAQAGSMSDIQSDNWVCGLKRYGSKPYNEQPTIHVITAPEHLGGALGYTWYASMFAYDNYAECENWVHIFEKTLPGLGGASVVDGGLADSGGVLAHEIGHQLMLHHTWYEAGQPPVNQQCVGSASQDPADIAAGKSDGVRDTPAQSQNGTKNSVTSILRFINCDPATGTYSNTTAFAQQSCTSAVGFSEGDKYFNNFNNLMSYGDKTCLRTLTPGQGARVRCAYKCMMQQKC